MMGNTRGLKQVTAWVDPDSNIKERCRRIRERNHRMTMSRITEEALLMYLPILEQGLGPAHEVPTQHKELIEVPG